MSDPRGWKKHEDVIEAAKKELLAELGLLGDKVTLDKIYDLLGQGMTAQCVKSVQMQRKTISGYVESVAFAISEVNPEKCFVHYKTEAGSEATLKTVTSTSVVLACTSRQLLAASIQVVEFY